MAQTIGTNSLTYPDKDATWWYPAWVQFAQQITDRLDAISTTAELSGDASPQLGGDLDLNSFKFLDSNGNEMWDVGTTASAVNYFVIGNAATGSAPSVGAAGSDTNVGLTSTPKGTGSNIFTATASVTGNLIVYNGTTIDDANSNELLDFAVTASAVNHLHLANAATGNGPAISAVGDDLNIGIQLSPQGSGVTSFGGGLKINGDLVPSADSTYDLGSASAGFRNLHVDAITFDGGTTSFNANTLVKAWAQFTSFPATGVSANDSYGISSINDDATGDFTLNFSNAFLNTDYAGVGITASDTSSTYCSFLCQRTGSSKTASAFPVRQSFTNAAISNSASDIEYSSIIFVGDTG